MNGFRHKEPSHWPLPWNLQMGENHHWYISPHSSKPNQPLAETTVTSKPKNLKKKKKIKTKSRILN